jgi:hypothetical protein
MEEQTFACTAPKCGFVGIAWAMWLPASDAMATANGGKRVALEDFPKFAICGKHGHLLRKTGIKVYRFAQTVEREEAFRARRASHGQWNAFASRFQNPLTTKKPSLIKRGRDGQNIGTGLNACSKMDARKRPVEKTASDPAPVERKDESTEPT